ncbi:MAG: pectin acetylesterase-family hydrolase [Myxococcota bacterium]
MFSSPSLFVRRTGRPGAPRPGVLRLCILVGAAHWALAAPAGAGVVPPMPDEPLDQCVADKLDAAAMKCQGSFLAWAKWERRKARSRSDRVERLDFASTLLATSWSNADDAADTAGVDCATATGDSSQVAKVARRGAKKVAKKLESKIDHNRKRDRVCSSRVLRSAGELCHALLAAESDHLESRFDDRLRDDLQADRVAALAAFGNDWLALEDDCQPPLSQAKVEKLVDDVVRDTVTAASVSPSVTDGWEMITPEASVDYEGQTLLPTCWDGEPWSFFVHRGSVNKLVMYYQGGGACWSAATCGGIPGIAGPTFKRSVGAGDNPANFSSGFADLSNPDNPFKDWNIVFVPYCTGDIHWGDAVVDYEIDLGDPEPRVTTMRHKGFVNAQVAEKFAREHFVHPEQVFVTGSSAGAYGAIVNSLYLQERAYPSADFAVVGDAGNGVITQDFLEEDLANWGIQANLPPWMPGLDVPLAELTAADLYIESAKTYPQNRFATYTTAFDGGNGGQTGFLQVMNNKNNALDWIRWWDSSCEWNEEMTALNARARMETLVEDNFRSYVGTGSAHTMWGRDKVYTDTTSGVPTVRDWLAAMLDDTEDWVDVECDDCGVLLEGDPRPDPDNPFNQPPYTPFDLENERIDCPVPDL